MLVDRIRLTDAEFAVLNALWEGGPQTIRELTETLYPAGTDSDYATVQKLLERLETKSCASRDRSRTAHVFSATLERGDLIDAQLQNVADKLCEGSLTPMLMHLVQGAKLTKRQRDTIREFLDKPQTRGRKGR